MKQVETRPRPAAGGQGIELQAAHWSDALRERGDQPDVRAAFERWRAEHPAHAEAFDRIDGAYRIALAANGSREMLELENEIMALGTARDRRRGRRFAVAAAVAAGLVAIVVSGFVATGGSWHELQYLRDRARYALAGETLYQTAAGQRLAVVLKDGSTLTLNTDSRAIVRYRDDTRGVNLVKGQALFEVAKDPAHPFVVTAGGRKVTALGTAFDVRVSGQHFAVTLIEGRIKVEQETPAGRTEVRTMKPAQLTAGEQLVATAADAAPIVREANVQRETSWRNGQLIFENDRLADAVKEINRYGGRRVVLDDARLGELRVSGIFNTGNTAVFVETLTNYFPLRVAESGPDEIVLAARTD